MDDHRFDALTKTLATGRTRRGAIGLLAGAAGLALGGAEARGRRGKGKPGRGPAPARVSAVCAAAGSKTTCTLPQAKAGANLKDCNYAGADLAGRSLSAANAARASFAGAGLAGANLSAIGLGYACLAGANLTGASLRGANLSGADLTGANLAGADLRGSNLTAAQLATATVSCGTLLPNGKPGTCPPGTSCVGGTCVCPPCQKLDGGACVPDPALDHACTGPCSSGEWCDAGACAGIAATVRVTDIGSRCSPGSPVAATACGVAVTAPQCSLCVPQTGCPGNWMPDGPSGASGYCSMAGIGSSCTTNTDCPTGQYCTSQISGNNLCGRICPF